MFIDQDDGFEMVPRNGAYTIAVSENREVKLKRGQRAIFGWHTAGAEFADGSEIPVGDDRTGSATIEFWQSGDLGKPWIAVFVGTVDEWRAAGNQLTDDLLFTSDQKDRTP